MNKIDDIPFDFSRRRLTIVVEDGPGPRRLITKGAFASIAPICIRIVERLGESPMDAKALERLEAFVREQGEMGARVLIVAQRFVPLKADFGVTDEQDMTFMGFLVFRAPLKVDAAATLGSLGQLGVRVKIVTGDNRYVAAHVAQGVGLDSSALLTGAEVANATDEALWHLAPKTNVFAEIDPQQKERIVRVLQRTGLSVGYLGDGINDAPALRAADVGISVETAVDVARESADVVLLRPDLGIVCVGIEVRGRSQNPSCDLVAQLA